MTTGFIEITVSQLKPWDKNYKNDDLSVKEKLKRNIKRNGLVQNLIVKEDDDGTFTVVNGNHRLEALIELKAKTAMCYNLGNVSDSLAYKIAITTNETRFQSDKKKLAEVIRDLNDEFGIEDLVKTLPYSSQDLENMQAALDFQWESEDALKSGSKKEDDDFESGGEHKEPTRKEEKQEDRDENLKKIELTLQKDISDRFLDLIAKITTVRNIETDPSSLDSTKQLKALNEEIRKLL